MGRPKPWLLGPPEEYLHGVWSKRDWRNVPGPFYCADTDNCLTGDVAPANVAFEDEFGAEFVYRQPRDEHEVHQLLSAACQEPFQAYACDGDEHWTLALVRKWWAERVRLLDWIAAAEPVWPEDSPSVFVLREYRAFITGGLESYLREYGFWLEHRRPAAPNEALPRLS
ncbi:ferredoxin [Mycobacterium sp. CBMA247]|nr:ferredoxin [Mycolicibacterium sp. CBMA 329]MUL88570.1 ferredoxin [Mycolicibacterium sp. CBMA 331]MUM00090.1 ferredoxin [Mycolicibacterium sp. CBMA 334]MUM29172.1 ferredoxin [Mycolicibacterium sp. CBMA 295]MUM40217.1 ferredoxin [Mycolicibacterium sp. CBMA 247]MUM44634.1 ferredoxin [Mycolicibacterium sp. CBMA 294]